MKRKNNLLALSFMLLAVSALGQMESYKYMRPISGVSDQWHSVLLPQMVVSEMQNNLRDVRIYGITSETDTVEVPYILKEEDPEYLNRQVEFTTLNSSNNMNGYFYSFSLSETDAINQIDLNFEPDNFDWRIRLEGSQDQSEWFTILDDYRVLSIKNNQIDFDYTTLTFPKSQYKYYRIRVSSSEEPKFRSASISQIDTISGRVISHPVLSITQIEEKSKNTVIDVKLKNVSRVSSVAISVENDFDYYRPITIKQLVDSTKTETGMRYSYVNLYSGTLNSLRPNVFSFRPENVSDLRIVVENGNNQPLNIGQIAVSGYQNKLIARFTEKANYFLVYGKEYADYPNYDIVRFEENIPENLSALNLGDATAIPKKPEVNVSPLFESERWLWAILVIVVALLGVFTVRMMKAKG